MYSSHTHGQQLPPPQHSSDFGLSGLVLGMFFCMFLIKTEENEL
ncbi:hypothetical protein PTET_b0470 [Pseudoalteromonas tetraodonis]|nr:hypothetical protein PTET_b0470 [Pseudoalteromonas tetraodonis]